MPSVPISFDPSTTSALLAAAVPFVMPSIFSRSVSLISADPMMNELPDVILLDDVIAPDVIVLLVLNAPFANSAPDMFTASSICSAVESSDLIVPAIIRLSLITIPVESSEEIEFTVVISPSIAMVNTPVDAVEVLIPLPPEICSTSVPPCRYNPTESSPDTLKIVSEASAALEPPALVPSCTTNLSSVVSTVISPTAPVNALFCAVVPLLNWTVVGIVYLLSSYVTLS